MAVEVKLKQWGNSMGIILPIELIKQKQLKENDTILVEVAKPADLSDVFGIIKKRKLSGQEAKDIAKRGWGT